MTTKRNTINVAGGEYPCYVTMGAMMRFKDCTGREVTTIKDSVSDLCTYMFCCVQSACARENVEFKLNLTEFADSLDPQDVAAWSARIGGNEEPEDKEEKKSI
mgnify:CR=1 FL=1